VVVPSPPPVPVPAGATSLIVVADFAVKLALVEPNSTAVAPFRLAPVIVTLVPPASGPFFGSTFSTVGSMAESGLARPVIAGVAATEAGAAKATIGPSTATARTNAGARRRAPSIWRGCPTQAEQRLSARLSEPH